MTILDFRYDGDSERSPRKLRSVELVGPEGFEPPTKGL